MTTEQEPTTPPEQEPTTQQEPEATTPPEPEPTAQQEQEPTTEPAPAPVQVQEPQKAVIYSKLIDETIEAIRPLDAAAMAAARERQDTLTKPPGSLGRLEALSVQLAGITGQATPQITGKKIIVFAGDHHVTQEGVSPYPAEVTPQMVHNFLNGGAAINVLAAQAGAELTIVDAGVDANLPLLHPNLTILKPGYGAGNIARGPAMHNWQAVRCLETGIRLAGLWAADKGFNLIAGGDMGIGNTTASAAITAAITGVDVEVVTGRGAGVDDEGLAAKIAIVRQALEVNQPDGEDGFDVLMKVGGFEIGMMAGLILGGAARQCIVALDGFISGAAALIAWRLCPLVAERVIAGHRSVEPGHNAALAAMGLTPLLDLEMRLGEGTGAALAMPIIEAAARCLSDMATFAEAGVSDRDSVSGEDDASAEGGASDHADASDEDGVSDQDDATAEAGVSDQAGATAEASVSNQDDATAEAGVSDQSGAPDEDGVSGQAGAPEQDDG